MLLIFIHELGHFFSAIALQVPVDRICLYPFGGISKLRNKINISLKKEFLILVMGPLTQIIFFYLIKDKVPVLYQELFRYYHYHILIFNLLPIYPLDGGRLLNLLFASCTSYKKSLLLSLRFSIFILVLIGLLVRKNIRLNILLLFGLLFYKIHEEYQKKEYYQQRFLLERYLEKIPFSKRCQVNKIEDFRRDYQHLIKKENRYYSEQEVLEEKFANF